MKILVVVGDCLRVNTSANLCHLAYVKGLLDSGHEVTVVSADDPNYDVDNTMKIPEEADGFCYSGVTLYEKLSKKKAANISGPSTNVSKAINRKSFKSTAVDKVKRFVLSLYGPHGVYSKIVKTARRFKSNKEYNYVLSLSTPPSSHLLTYKLLKSKHIKAKHWIQIWEDPWYTDAYGFNGKDNIYKEEKRLLSFAEKVCYVSPLTLENQKKLYPDSAHKMYWQPLPYYYKNQEQEICEFKNNRYGYFGDYAPASRDLEPFYKAARNCSIDVNICGSPNNLFEHTENINIYPRLPLDKLRPIEDKTNVLIFLCNRKGGQIPGKIYQYSATNKTILFILDGTDEEKAVLKAYFEKFNRYVFCENTVEDITRAIKDIESGNIGKVVNEPVEDFCPTETIKKILAGENG